MKAQTNNDCGTVGIDSTAFENLPWFGNNAYLEYFLDSIGYNNNTSNATNRIVYSDVAKFKVPIKFWVYRNNNGLGGPTLRQLQNYIANLNRFFTIDNRTLIGFYMKCEIGFIDDDNHTNVDNTNESYDLIRDHFDEGAINIHIANSVTVDGRAVNGVYYPIRFLGSKNGIFLASQTYLEDRFAGTIAHEVGHYFELEHTHNFEDKGRCRQEAIDRNRTWPTWNFCFGKRLKSDRICESTGDALSDTPADPDLSNNNNCVFNAGANYNGRTDFWGDSYVTPPAGSPVPSTVNLLNYNGNRGCRNNFTRQQIAVMLHSIYNGKNKIYKSSWQESRGEYDIFEMDNFQLTASQINFGIQQEHNFHQQYNGSGNWSQCDVDWVRFVSPCNINANIVTAGIASRPNANTRLTLFNNAMTQLAQNDNISTANLFSSINWTFVAGQEYFIRIDNVTQTGTTYYTLQIGGNLSLIGDNNVCTTSNTYSVSNLPTGSTIT